MRTRTVTAALILVSLACSSTEPVVLEGSYQLMSENGQALPSDPFAPSGCCLTLSGSLTLTADTYSLQTSHRNKNNNLTFANAEEGTYARASNTLMFSRTSGSGVNFPYLLGPGTIAANGNLTLLWGDEGPGSNQVSAVFAK
ncbi:MAG: hypothetical protein WD801_13260 [Gemmatimonadaceae bacterium]